MPRSERCFNVLLSLSILSWAVLGLTTTGHLRPPGIQIAVSALHVCVGTLVLLRAPVENAGSLASCLSSLPALVISGWALRFAPASTWNLPAQVVFFGGAMLAIVSFLYLGRCFSILPASRGTVTRGPFRVVRHPAYFGELLMICGCWLAAPTLVTSWPVIGILPLLALRIVAEERVMATRVDYADYLGRVRWRLIPLLW